MKRILTLVVCAFMLCSCFVSKESLIEPSQASQFLPSGTELRQREVNGAESDQYVIFTQRGTDYALQGNDEIAGALIRFLDIGNGRDIGQVKSEIVYRYILFKSDHDHFALYEPDCRNLTDIDRENLGVAVDSENRTCYFASIEQLAGAFTAIEENGLRPTRYYYPAPN